MKEQKFFRCKLCGNLMAAVTNSGAPMICCGETMGELVPNTVEAATEKHIPVVTTVGDTVTVKVGAVTHPMTPEHHIEFIYLQTEHGGQLHRLNVEGAPEASFKVLGGSPVAAYEYCNLHGLWKLEINK